MKISVIIPCLNSEDYLRQTIISVLNQSLNADEIIVADNGSTDDSREIARSFGSRVKLIEVPEPGAPAAREAGVRASLGDALMFLDADDLIGPGALRALHDVLDSGGGDVACCPWYRLEYAGGAWNVAPASCAPRRVGQDSLSAWLTGWYHPPCSVLWSRAAYERSGGWDKSTALNQDGDIMMRGLIEGNRLTLTQNGAAFYRRLPGEAQSLSGRRKTKGGIEARIAVLDRLASRLSNRGILHRYAGPLSEAYEQIARDASPAYRDLAGLCEERIRLHRKNRGASYPIVHAVQVALTRVDHSVRRKTSLSRGGAVRLPAPSVQDSGDENAAGELDPLVSVVVPTFNRCATLGRCMDSVLSQDYPNLELLVVDDGSTDETGELLESYDDSRLRVLRQDENKGVAAARNRGLAEARGEYIAFLDSDDIWLPGKLRRQIDVFRKGTSRLGLVISGVETLLSDGERRIDIPGDRGSLFEVLLVRNVLHGAPTTGVIRRDVFNLVGGFDERLPAIEDYEFWLRVSRFFEIECVSEPLARYYDMGDYAESGRTLRVSRNFVRNREARRMIFERYGSAMQWAGVDHLFLLDSADRELGSPAGNVRYAFTLAGKAIARRPFAPYSYRWALTRLGRQMRRKIMSRSS